MDSELREGGFEEAPRSEQEFDLDMPEIELVPVSAEIASPVPPPLEAFIKLSHLAAEKLAKPTVEIKHQIDNQTEAPTEGELERSHEIKHFDEPNHPAGAASVASVLDKMIRPIETANVADEVASRSETIPSLSQLRQAVTSGRYKTALIGGSVGGIGLILALLLLGVVR